MAPPASHARAPDRVSTSGTAPFATTQFNPTCIGERCTPPPTTLPRNARSRARPSSHLGSFSSTTASFAPRGSAATTPTLSAAHVSRRFFFSSPPESINEYVTRSKATRASGASASSRFTSARRCSAS